MKFRKLVLYDFATEPWSPNILARISQYAESVAVVLAPGEYCGALSSESIEGADALLVRPFDNYPDALFEDATLRYIGTTHTDVSHFNHTLLKRKGITLRNVTGYSSPSVAELTISVMLAHARRLPGALDFVRSGGWGFEPFLGSEVRGKTLGIVGLGNIGTYVARVAQALGMRVLYYSRSRKPEAEVLGIEYSPLPELIASSQFISLHCALHEETRGILSGEMLGLVRPGALILNSARSELIDLGACFEGCEKGLFSIWFDELQDEAWRKKFAVLDNVWLTPDYAWWTEEAQERLRELTFKNIESFLSGEMATSECG